IADQASHLGINARVLRKRRVEPRRARKYETEQPLRIPQREVESDRRPQRNPTDDRSRRLEMVEERRQVVSEGRDPDFLPEADRTRLAMAPEIERDQAQPRGRRDESEGLVDIAPKAMLKDEREPVAGFSVAKVDAVARKRGHQAPFPAPALRRRNATLSAT